MHRTLRYVPLLLIGLAACGDDGGAAPLDAPLPIDAIDAPGLPSPCDTIAQNCGAGFKCTMVRAQRQCVAVAATPLALDAPCTQRTDDLDDCDVGLACYLGTCQRLCTAAMPACANGGSCFQYQTLQDGACQDPCTLFDSSTCAAGRTCEPGFRIGGASGPGLRCRPIGTVPDGDDCASLSEQCLEDSVCGTMEGFFCGAICDATHPCAAGTCDLIPNATYGVCS